MNGFRQFFSPGATETGYVHACWTYTSRWSRRCSPTPGRSCTTGTAEGLELARAADARQLQGPY